MKRVTIALGDEMYVSLLEYAADRSKREMRRYSLGEAIRELVASQLPSFASTMKREALKRTLTANATVSAQS